jgi:hypothetical protein
MIPPFEEAFEALLDQYKDTPREEIISALELKLMALREEQDDEQNEDES